MGRSLGSTHMNFHGMQLINRSMGSTGVYHQRQRRLIGRKRFADLKKGIRSNREATNHDKRVKKTVIFMMGHCMSYRFTFHICFTNFKYDVCVLFFNWTRDLPTLFDNFKREYNHKSSVLDQTHVQTHTQMDHEGNRWRFSWAGIRMNEGIIWLEHNLVKQMNTQMKHAGESLLGWILYVIHMMKCTNGLVQGNNCRKAPLHFNDKTPMVSWQFSQKPIQRV